jgi:hypothetical protein
MDEAVIRTHKQSLGGVTNYVMSSGKRLPIFLTGGDDRDSVGGE